MDLFYRTEEGNDYCMHTERFTISHLMPEEKTMTIHIHDFYEIYYSISGGKEFFISNKYYEIQPHDVFFIGPNENHHITQLENINHERINIAIHPKFLKYYSTPETPLATCFHNPTGRVINLPEEVRRRFEYLIKKIVNVKGLGADLLENMYLCEILILLQQCEADSEIKHLPNNGPTYTTAQAILQYINNHLTEEICLEQLSKEFFISQSYLCRLFKRYTGITINKYICARRISLATTLMNEGARPSDVFAQIGFKNYNNFFKTFVEIVGTSPKNYMKYNK